MQANRSPAHLTWLRCPTEQLQNTRFSETTSFISWPQTVSLGCDAVYLQGGATRDTPPTPLLLHSGDVVVMAGPTRACYHGKFADVWLALGRQFASCHAGLDGWG